MCRKSVDILTEKHPGCQTFEKGKIGTPTNCFRIQNSVQIIRVCDENEEPNDAMKNIVLPIVIGTLVISLMASKFLQVIGDDLELYRRMRIIRPSVIKDLMTAKYQIERSLILQDNDHKRQNLGPFEKSLEKLIDRANPGILNDQDKSSGDGCLHLAFYKGYFDLVKIMIGKGGSPTMKNDAKESVKGLLEQKQNKTEYKNKFTTWNGSEMYLKIEKNCIVELQNNDVLDKSNSFYLMMYSNFAAEIIQEEVLNYKKVKAFRKNLETNLLKLGEEEEYDAKLDNLANEVSKIVPESAAKKCVWSIMPIERILLTKPINLKWIQFWLAVGATLKSKNSEGQTPWQMFQTQYVQCQNQEDQLRGPALRDAVGLLLKFGAKANEGPATVFETPLHFAAKQNNIELLTELIKYGGDINATKIEGTTPLHIASAEDNIDVAKILIKNGANIKAECSRQSKISIGKGTVILAGHKVGITPFHFVQSQEIAKLLIENGADVKTVNSEGKSALHLAKDETFVEMLIRDGVEINTRDRFGNTPLHMVTFKNNLKCAEILIKNGADVNALNNEGISALHLAEDGNLSELLIREGAEINIRDHDGNTPLHIATFKNNLKCAEILIKNGADVKAVNSKGQTALHLALHNEKLFQVLIDAGADVCQKDNLKEVESLTKKEVNVQSVINEKKTEVQLGQDNTLIEILF